MTDKPSATVERKAERRVITAAFACLSRGWIFDSTGQVCRPDAAQKLEDALELLKEARKHGK